MNNSTEWQHFQHVAVIGIRGYGITPAEAFSNTAVAMTAVIPGPQLVFANKDVSAVVDSADHVGLARKVARLEPLVCIKG